VPGSANTKLNKRNFSVMNPLQTEAFEFVEYTAADQAGLASLKKLFEALGFIQVASCVESPTAGLFVQGEIRFLINPNKSSFAAHHGPSASGMAWRVAEASQAYQYALSQGAKSFEGQGAWPNVLAVEGIGGSALYFIDEASANQLYYHHLQPIVGANWAHQGHGLHEIDHLTHNVRRGQMDAWSSFYENIANFKEIRYFDIEGKVTGLISRAMTGPCGKIRIPINESIDDQSQIEEFLREYNGEGIQHIALSTDNIYATVDALKEAGIKFLSTPLPYYEKLDTRVVGHGEPVAELQRRQILLDGAPVEGAGILLQIFTHTVIGPIFFEIIQRKGNEGFGEGNFRALFESIEDDQIRRGVIQTKEVEA
jgi:4-hydroxyphenylpyruvate dioxygenase